VLVSEELLPKPPRAWRCGEQARQVAGFHGSGPPFAIEADEAAGDERVETAPDFRIRGGEMVQAR
jgi:hypothetical protein